MAKKKQTTNSINIDGVDYKEDDLSDLSKLHVKRINELRSELTSLQMMIDEKNVLVSAYANAIKEAMKPVEDEGEAVNE